MRPIIPKSLFLLADRSPKPLYVVGGSVRDFLAGMHSSSKDWDVCSPLPADIFVDLAKSNGFTIQGVYKNTGTVKLRDTEGTEFEFSPFRSDKYVRGVHVPVEICFTEDITLDAKRRDFTCNAIYYDVKNDSYVDPLNGISAVADKRLTTVAPAEKVFGEDGLRLMRLARQAAQLGFTPDADCLRGAAQNASLIADISPERIFAELSAILSSDQKYGIPDGPYKGLKILEQTGVLSHLLPELTLGKGMLQRPDFHKYDVLEHSLRAVCYAPPEIRLAALLHDVGKPFCMERDGNGFQHPEEGAQIAKTILKRLKAPKRETEKIVSLVSLHMYDFNCETKETKLRRFFVKHYPLLPDLLKLKQADFSACTDDLSLAPTCRKWNVLLETMERERAPMTLKQLAVNGKDLLSLNVPPERISEILQTLLLFAAVHPTKNKKERLLKLAQSQLRIVTTP
ncbi:MAG: CCA tRNA nucleotidyltransferase [Clostridia bacterium]|nr:CCA tRNA nucleotidyltransferase [Clostridia bacterium]